MKPWLRANTIEWIAQLESRVVDFNYHLVEAATWLDAHDITSQRTRFMCLMMVVVWVAWHRSEQVSRREVFELFQIAGWEDAPDDVLELGAQFRNSTLEALLEGVLEEEGWSP